MSLKAIVRGYPDAMGEYWLHEPTLNGFNAA